MSKKQFIALANAIREFNSTPRFEPFSPDQISTLADFCAEQNPNFKRDRWLNYIAGNCGPNGGTVKR